MKKQTSRKGFTITELVIVILVIAILAAVLIPAFSDLIAKANVSADTQLVRSVNVILKAEASAGRQMADTNAMKAVLVDNGITSLELKSEDHVLYWVQADSCVVLYDDAANVVVYPEEYIGADMTGWVLLDGEGMAPSQPENAQVLHLILNQQNGPITEYLAKPGYNGVYTTSQAGSISLASMLPEVRVFSDLPEAAKTAVVTDLDSGAVFYTLTVKDRTCTVHSLIPNHVYTVEFKDASGNPVEFVENGVIYTRAQIAVTGQVRLIYTETAQSNKAQGVAKGTGLRDIGGWQVAGGGYIKYGKIYRSAKTEILSASEADKAFLKDTLGIRWVFDLRGNIWDEGVQVESRVDGLGMGEEGFCHLEGDASARMYHEALLNISGRYVNKPVYEKIFASVAAGEPILYHCTHGTDRTGTVTFMIQALLGVSDDDLIREFELTKYCQYDAASNVTHEKFQPFIDELNTYDGTTYAEKAYNWFLVAGFTQAEIDAFRSNMIENGQVVTYGQVSYGLTNVNTSNNETLASSQEDYVATLTPVDGYDISGMTVTVTVGGVDKTAQCYDGATYTVTIPKEIITGDIQISASVSLAAGLTTNFDANAFELVGDPPKAGTTYTATLKAKGAYVITRITVQMGSTTVLEETGLMYEKAISVPNVAGNITVTAEGVENQVRKATAFNSSTIYGTKGFLDGRYISDGANEGLYAGTDAATTATGWMALDWENNKNAEGKIDVYIYIKDGEIQDGNHTRFYFYDSATKGAPKDATAAWRPARSALKSNFSGVTYKAEGSSVVNYIKFTLDMNDHSDRLFFRTSVVGVGDNLFVSFNQPILPDSQLANS